MPTHKETDRFLAQHDRLTLRERTAFKVAVRKFVHDLRTQQFRKGLRVKKLKGHPTEWEITWADDGRAVFEYGPSVLPGHPHVVWLHIGGHEILDER